MTVHVDGLIKTYSRPSMNGGEGGDSFLLLISYQWEIWVTFWGEYAGRRVSVTYMVAIALATKLPGHWLVTSLARPQLSL